GRYTIFGNHFADFQGTVYRLDQHPVMSKHPITPMDEADLGIHLQKQTEQNIERVSILDMESGTGEPHASQKDSLGITLFDATEEKHMEQFAEKIWSSRKGSSRFLIGSSGIEYALGLKWKKDEISLNKEKERKPAEIDQMLVVSGSVSDVTKQQLNDAESAGFRTEKLPYQLLTENDIPEDYLNHLIDLLDSEKKVVLYTAKGPDDPIIGLTKNHLCKSGISKDEIGIYIGKQLGKWTKFIMEKARLKRLVVSGGDTSGFVTSELG